MRTIHGVRVCHRGHELSFSKGPCPMCQHLSHLCRKRGLYLSDLPPNSWTSEDGRGSGDSNWDNWQTEAGIERAAELLAHLGPVPFHTYPEHEEWVKQARAILKQYQPPDSPDSDPAAAYAECLESFIATL